MQSLGMWGAHGRRSRVVVVVVLMLGMLGAMAVTPVRADASDDLESVRASVTEYYNVKINYLAGHKAETANEDAKAIYSSVINELASIRDTSVATAETADALWELKSLAGAIYAETVEAAEAAEGSGDPLADAKQEANGTIEYKIHKLRSWIEGCDDEEAIAIVEDGIQALLGLFEEVAAADSVDEVHAIKERAHAIYHETMERAQGAKGGEEEPKEEPKEESDAERKARELREFRSDVVELAHRKEAILASASEAAEIPAVVEIFAEAAAEVHALGEAAGDATSIGALKELKAAILETYETAKRSANEILDDHEGDSPEDAIAEYLEQLVRFVKEMTEAAAEAAASSDVDVEDELAALFEAKGAVLEAVEDVIKSADSGARLDDRWDALNEARSAYRQALVHLYIALGEPLVIAGIQIPG